MGVVIQVTSFSISARYDGAWSASRPVALLRPLEERSYRDPLNKTPTQQVSNFRCLRAQGQTLKRRALFKQDRQCTDNESRDAFMSPLLQWKNNKCYTFEVCISSMQCGLSGCTILSTLSHQRQEFRGKNKLLKIKCIFWLTLLLRLKYFPF